MHLIINMCIYAYTPCTCIYSCTSYTYVISTLPINRYPLLDFKESLSLHFSYTIIRTIRRLTLCVEYDCDTRPSEAVHSSRYMVAGLREEGDV